MLMRDLAADTSSCAAAGWYRVLTLATPGNTTAQGGVTSLLPAGCFVGDLGTALLALFFDSEPAASPPARHSCGTLAAAAQIVSRARLAARGLRSARGGTRGTA